MTPAEKLAAAMPKKNGRVMRKRHRLRCTIRAKRKSLHLTIAAVADVCDEDFATVQRIEMGHDPRLSIARKLANFFGMTIDELWPKK